MRKLRLSLREAWDKPLFIKWNNSFKIGWSIHSLVYRCLSTWRAPVVSYCALLASEHASSAAWSFAENTKHTNTLKPPRFKSSQVNPELKLLQLIEEIKYCDNFNSQNMIPNSFFRPQPAIYLVRKLRGLCALVWDHLAVDEPNQNDHTFAG